MTFASEPATRGLGWLLRKDDARFLPIHTTLGTGLAPLGKTLPRRRSLAEFAAKGAAALAAIVNVSSRQAQRPVRGALPYATARPPSRD